MSYTSYYDNEMLQLLLFCIRNRACLYYLNNLPTCINLLLLTNVKGKRRNLIIIRCLSKHIRSFINGICAVVNTKAAKEMFVGERCHFSQNNRCNLRLIMHMKQLL